MAVSLATASLWDLSSCVTPAWQGSVWEQGSLPLPQTSRPVWVLNGGLEVWQEDPEARLWLIGNDKPLSVARESQKCQEECP